MTPRIELRRLGSFAVVVRSRPGATNSVHLHDSLEVVIYQGESFGGLKYSRLAELADTCGEISVEELDVD